MEMIRTKRIEVNDSGEFITLDFDDPEFLCRYYAMLKRLAGAYERFANGLDGERELRIYFLAEVDGLFGEDACRKVHGDILPPLEAHMRFFEALRPYFEAEAERRRRLTEKYSAERRGDSVQRNIGRLPR